MRFLLPRRLSRVVFPNFLMIPATQARELHPDSAMIRPLHCAGSLYEAVAERELEPEDQLGTHRDCLLRGEESPAGPDVGYAPVLGGRAMDLVLHRDVAGNTRRVSRISRVIHGDGGGEESGEGEASPRSRSTTLPIKAAFKGSTARNSAPIPVIALGPISSPPIHATCAGIERVWEG